MIFFRKKKVNRAAAEQEQSLPRHVAIIMDGNGRWAKKRGLPRTAGHAAGAETFRKIATYCKNLGIPYLTVYAFSTENWKRPQQEVGAIMGLLKKYLIEAVETMAKDRIRLNFLGELSLLAPELLDLYQKTLEIGAGYAPAIQVNVCLNYGGRDEILRAARALAQECQTGSLRPEDIDETALARHLDTGGFPDPDLVIRPSGELRISNFLLWQSAYAEFYFTPVLWPDFDEACLDAALAAYGQRQRRYGGI